MTQEEFVAKNKLIADRLDEIAARTARMALTGTADTSNPAFRELMVAQDQLLKAADKLLDTYQAL
jgi:hypothetical protein